MSPKTKEIKTPELDRMKAAKESLGTEHVGQFLEWLRENRIVLARWVETVSPTSLDRLVSIYESDGDLLARYAGVDLKKVEQEKQRLLKNLHR